MFAYQVNRILLLLAVIMIYAQHLITNQSSNRVLLCKSYKGVMSLTNEGAPYSLMDKF